MSHISHLYYLPIALPLFLVMAGVIVLLIIFLPLQILRHVYMSLGVSSGAAVLLLVGTLVGGFFNIPIAELPGRHVEAAREFSAFGVTWLEPVEVDWPGTIIAINLGGAVIPIALSLYLLFKNNIWLPAIIATAVVSAVCYAVAEPVRGAGIAIPIFIPPLVACAVSCIVAWSQAAPVAYVSGSLGTLIGADLMNFAAIRSLGTPVASIGGAGTFDGIFVTGIVAVVLASIIGAIGARRVHPGPA